MVTFTVKPFVQQSAQLQVTYFYVKAHFPRQLQ